MTPEELRALQYRINQQGMIAACRAREAALQGNPARRAALEEAWKPVWDRETGWEPEGTCD